MSSQEKLIDSLDCTTRQKNILKVMYQYDQGWISEDVLEERLEKLFTDKRYAPKNK